MEDIYTQIGKFFRNLFYGPTQDALQELGVNEDIAKNIEIVIADRETMGKDSQTQKRDCTFAYTGALAENGGKNSLSFKLDEDRFVKIQLSDQTDPLINEVIINKVINSDGLNGLFSRYIDHCLYKGKQALVTKYMDITSIGEMFDKMPEPSNDPKVRKQYCALLSQLDQFVGAYIKFASTIGFTHNDMHFGNLVIHESKFKVIDYGRSCLDPTRVKGFENIVKCCCAKYGLNPEVIKGLFPTGGSSSSKRLAYFQIVDTKYGYMTDIASLCLMVLPLCGELFEWPECLMFNANTEKFKVDMSKGRNPDTATKYPNLHNGIYFLAAYISTASLGSASLGDVHIDELLSTLFWPNGMCKNTEYHKVKNQVHTLYDTLNQQSSSSGGRSRLIQKGGTPKLICKRKARLKAFSTSTNLIITDLVKHSFETLQMNLAKSMSKPCKGVGVDVGRIAAAASAAEGGKRKKNVQTKGSKINILKQ